MTEHHLTQKQHNFTLYYFKTGKPAQSYINAGYRVKDTGVARRNASRLLTNADVQSLLEKLRKEAEDASVMDVLERKQRLTEIGRGNIGQFVEAGEGGARIKVELETLNSGAVQEITTDEIKLGKGEDAPRAEVTKIKLHNPMQAIDLLNKMDGVYSDQPPINIDNRQVHIHVESKKAKKLTERISAGEGTG